MKDYLESPIQFVMDLSLINAGMLSEDRVVVCARYLYGTVSLLLMTRGDDGHPKTVVEVIDGRIALEDHLSVTEVRERLNTALDEESRAVRLNRRHSSWKAEPWRRKLSH